MRSLNKTQQEQQNDLVRQLNAARDRVVGYVSTINDMIATDLNVALAAYNDILAEVGEFRDGLVSEMDEYYSDKSEKWQTGEAGEAYDEWKSSWESLSVDPEPMVERIDEPEMGHAEELDALGIQSEE